MCGRFSLGLPRDRIRHVDGDASFDDLEWEDEEDFHPRHNIAPRSNAPVIRRRNPGPSDAPSDAELVIQTMRWGLVPHWAKHEDKSLSTTNARAEGLIGQEPSTMWSSIKGKTRCAVICEGYYEWLKKGKDRVPHFTKHARPGKLMHLAGLYDSVVLEGDSKPLHTFTIVTTDANKEFSWLHDRQPVILSTREALDTWLDTSSQNWSQALTQLVKPYNDPHNALECYQVPKEVGKVGTESPDFIRPIAQRKGGLESMFAKQKDKASPPKALTSPAKTATPSSPARDDAGPSSQKRRRSSSPTADADTPAPKTQKLNTWEDDDAVEYTDADNKQAPRENTPQSSSQPSPQSPRKKAASSSSPKKKPVGSGEKDSAGIPKITQFFKRT